MLWTVLSPPPPETPTLDGRPRLDATGEGCVPVGTCAETVNLSDAETLNANVPSGPVVVVTSSVPLHSWQIVTVTSGRPGSPASWTPSLFKSLNTVPQRTPADGHTVCADAGVAM